MSIFLSDFTKDVHFKNKSDEYLIEWSYPNCVLAIHEKHVRLRCRSISDSQYFNYKNYFLIGLLAMVDANHKFVYVCLLK